MPEDCQLQELRLESAGRSSLEQRVGGEIWFDDLAIRRTTGLTAAARADGLARGRDTGEKAESDADGLGQEGAPEQDSPAPDAKDAQDDQNRDHGGGKAASPQPPLADKAGAPGGYGQ